MRKKKIISFILIVTLFTSFWVSPIEAEAQTIAQFEAEVERYTQELQAKKDKIAKNDAEVAAIKNRIIAIEAEIREAEKEIKRLEEEIAECEREIEKKTEESRKIIEYYQISNGNNVYLEYAFGANNITDMIYRLSIVEQLTEYNDQIMKELDALIKKNEESKASLEGKKASLQKLEKELEDQKARINADTNAIKETMPGIEEQIKAAKAQIRDLESMGCGRNEEKQACINRYFSSGSTPSTNGFYRPMEYGYITQGYGGGHMGIDLSSSNKSITVYPIAAGVVSARYYDMYGALVVKIRHNVGGRIIYSTYAHLRSWSVSVGQIVSPWSPIGQMGSTGWSTGPHLHLEITSCDWKSQGGGCTWGQYVNSTISPTRYVVIPSSWNNR